LCAVGCRSVRSTQHLKGHEASEVRLGRAAARAHSRAAEETLLLFESTQTRAYYKVTPRTALHKHNASSAPWSSASSLHHRC